MGGLARGDAVDRHKDRCPTRAVRARRRQIHGALQPGAASARGGAPCTRQAIAEWLDTVSTAARLVEFLPYQP